MTGKSFLGKHDDGLFGLHVWKILSKYRVITVEYCFLSRKDAYIVCFKTKCSCVFMTWNFYCRKIWCVYYSIYYPSEAIQAKQYCENHNYFRQYINSFVSKNSFFKYNYRLSSSSPCRILKNHWWSWTCSEGLIPIVLYVYVDR